MAARTDLRHFALANPLYAAASVSIYEVNEDFERTDRLAPIYPSLTGMGLLANPQKLDSEGKWEQPIYVDRPVVLVVEGGALAASHQTAVTGIVGGWRADWQPGATYSVDQVVRDGPDGSGTTNLYICREYHVAGPVWSADLGAGIWELYVDAQGVAQSVVDQAEAAAILAANATVDERIAEITAGTGNVPTPTAPEVGRFLKATAATAGGFGWTVPQVADIGDISPTGALVAKADDPGGARTAIAAAAAAELAQEIADRASGDAALTTSIGEHTAQESPLYSVATATPHAWTHGLGGVPKQYEAVLVCDTTEHGYSPNDEARIVNSYADNTGYFCVALVPTSTTITLLQFGNALYIPTKAGTALALLTPSRWRWRIRASLK